MVDNFLGSLVHSCYGEGGTLQTNVTGVCGECSQCLRHTGFAPAHGMCAFPVYTVQALGCSAENCLRRALDCVHFPGLSLSGSFTWVLNKGTDLVGPVFCALPRGRAAQVTVTRCLASVVAPTYCLSCPCYSVFWVYNRPTFSGGHSPSRIPRRLG